ncbi:hypothetical protein CAE01nite_21410 [Cellulomonas aerilata]|uniref:Uncharacterized protein n=1 Tax=Cellulomonas aerilata TaxID=515326 RepID=A0A512DD60_9CELL|nr:hypothetical protein CAE01nite_21410 [Cellulomonas aerilata]
MECAGCGLLDVPLCAACRAMLDGPAWRCEAGAPRLDRVGRAPLPVWTLTAYTGAVRELVVAWKDRGRVDLTPVLTAALAAAARDVAPVLRAAGATGAAGPARPAGSAGPPGPAGAGPPLLVVPAPSSGAARRRRGVDLTGRLAVAVARACTTHGVPASAAPVLVQRRGARDQVGLGARARRSNVGGRIRWRRGAARPAAGQPVLLVDDVLTTGATLAACDDVVRGAGARVVAALTLAATPPPGRRAAQAPVALQRACARSVPSHDPVTTTPAW